MTMCLNSKNLLTQLHSLSYMKVKLKSQCTCCATNASDSCTGIMMRIETIEKRKMPPSKYKSVTLEQKKYRTRQSKLSKSIDSQK